MSPRAVHGSSAAANGSGSAPSSWDSIACAATSTACRSPSASISRGIEPLPRDLTAGGEIVLVHSSDLHVDDDRIAAQHDGDGTAGLRAVLATARRFGADIVLLAGDTFDNHMVSAATIDRAGEVLAEAGLPVVILPGNHDPLRADSVYARGGLAAIPNLRILGMTHDRA